MLRMSLMLARVVDLDCDSQARVGTRGLREGGSDRMMWWFAFERGYMGVDLGASDSISVCVRFHN